MLHLTKCRHAAQFWRWIFRVCIDALRMQAPDDPSIAIIFNVRVAKPVHSHDRFTPRSKARIGANRESAVPDHHQDIEIFS